MQGDNGVALRPTLDGRQTSGANDAIRGVGSTLTSRPRGPRKPASLHLDLTGDQDESEHVDFVIHRSILDSERLSRGRLVPGSCFPSYSSPGPQLASVTSKGHPPNSALLSPPLLITHPRLPPSQRVVRRPSVSARPPSQSLTLLNQSGLFRPKPKWRTPHLSPSIKVMVPPSNLVPLFAEHRAIVLFLRHFFCPMCQDYVSSLSSLVKRPMLRELGSLCDYNEEDARTSLDDPENGELLPKQVQLVLISCGKATLVEKYKHMFGLPFKMFADPELKVYEALGMGKMGDAVNGGNKKRWIPNSRRRSTISCCGHPGPRKQRCEWHDGESMRSPSSAHSSTTGSFCYDDRFREQREKGRIREARADRWDCDGGDASGEGWDANVGEWGRYCAAGGEFVLGPG
ncbi:hypothetical protein FA13DRAFT_879368 [Coprinellus micaceus]|uniref:Uncharacterized protein n=1 Tax=Coprinellus micaceus TaxID=71717 RepID=A0A4Y7RZT7_COPMI|nr:hypothetical protein FA13DRAFT_879368 [Coprinellus micaceus]